MKIYEKPEIETVTFANEVIAGDLEGDTDIKTSGVQIPGGED